MDRRQRLRELFNISWPVIMEQIFITMMGLVNQLMAANAIGEYAVSAINVIDGVNHIIIAVFAALTTGGSIIVAQNCGRKDILSAKKAGGQAIIIASALSVLIFAFFMAFKTQTIEFLFKGAERQVIDAGLTYFAIIIFTYPVLALTQTIFGVVRGSGNTGMPMLITIIMNVFNIILGYLLIFSWELNIFGFSLRGPGFGVAGAAVALTLSRAVGLVLAALYIFFVEKLIKLNKAEYFKLDINIQKTILKIGVPTSVETSLFQVGRMITQLYIIRMGTSAMFANSVGSAVFGFVNVPGNAFATAVMILIGQRMGRGQEDDVVKTTTFATKAGMVIFTGLTLILVPSAGLIAKAYNASEVSTPLIIGVLRIGLIAAPFLWPASFITPAALRATGDVKYTMIVAIISMWTLRIGLGYVLGINLGLGVYGVWYAMFADWALRSILFSKRLYSGKWRLGV